MAQEIARRSIELAADEPLIADGAGVSKMYVVLSATAPLVVLKRVDGEPESREVAVLECPTVLGEIGMWRGKSAVATVVCWIDYGEATGRTLRVIASQSRGPAAMHAPVLVRRSKRREGIDRGGETSEPGVGTRAS